MTAELMTLQVRSRRQWRAWLAKHHTSSPGVWLVFYKAHTGVKSMRYEDTVREALCFGWIDSLIKRLDDDRYALKVTPRQPTSKWSDINRKRWVELKAADLLTSAALSSTHRFRLMSDHLLVGCRGVTLRAYRSSSRRFIRLSIHPKQSASRTVSSWRIDFTSVWAL